MMSKTWWIMAFDEPPFATLLESAHDCVEKLGAPCSRTADLRWTMVGHMCVLRLCVQLTIARLLIRSGQYLSMFPLVSTGCQLGGTLCSIVSCVGMCDSVDTSIDAHEH